MEFEQVVETIEGKHRFGNACGREVTAEMMQALGFPEKDFNVIHIAGTNGKGSVCAFVTSILLEYSKKSEGKIKIGTFTSPHLVDFTERIMINNKPISHDDAARIGQQLLAYDFKLSPTMFDYCLGIAMLYFKEQQVDYVVLETGLGGSKDSTSGLCVTPVVSAITSIGLDHTMFLGDTYEQIAAEKAGIIKQGTKLVLGQMPSEAVAVIEEVANSLCVNISYARPVADSVELGLFGSYQRKNAGTACEIIKQLPFRIDESTILDGLKNAKWSGRMDIISIKPFIMLDGAHNPEGVQALHDSLVDCFPNEKFTFIMAVMADKDYQSMASIMSDISKRIYACNVDYSRALKSKELVKVLQQQGFEASMVESYNEAIEEASIHDEKIIVFGSLYFIGEILAKI